MSSGRARAHMSTSSQIDNGWPGGGLGKGKHGAKGGQEEMEEEEG